MELQVQIAGGKWSGLALSIKTFLPKTGVSKNFLYFHRESEIYFNQKTEISERLYIFTKKPRNLKIKIIFFQNRNSSRLYKKSKNTFILLKHRIPGTLCKKILYLLKNRSSGILYKNLICFDVNQNRNF